MQYLCIVHVYMFTFKYTRILRTCWYVAFAVNRPSVISQAAAVAVKELTSSLYRQEKFSV